MVTQKIIAGIVLLLISPLILVIIFVIKIDSLGPVLFTQKRRGWQNKPFYIYKFRTMVQNAEKKKRFLLQLNEADGPVFKIKNDPRFTRVGKFLAAFGLDELPQLLNIIRGEMSFVGPRPLPIAEADKIPSKYQLRNTVLPGITSLWVINGTHQISFKKWMELDVFYVKHKSWKLDLKIVLKTIAIFFQKGVRIERSKKN